MPAVEGVPLQEFKDRLKISRICASPKRYPQSCNNYPIFYHQNRVKEFNQRVVEEFTEIEKETGPIDLYHCRACGSLPNGCDFCNLSEAESSARSLWKHAHRGVNSLSFT